MVSWQMTAVATLMRATRKRRFADPAGGRAMLDRPKGDPSPPRSLARRCEVTTREVAGFPVVSIRSPGTAPGGPVVVHLHGGAYVNEVVRQHWQLAQACAEGLGVDDPRVSPLAGDLAGLPPVDLWVGDRDVCLPDSRLLRDRLRAAGVEVSYVEEPGALHVYPILPVPEGRAARRDLVARAGARLGVSGGPAPGR